MRWNQIRHMDQIRHTWTKSTSFGVTHRGRALEALTGPDRLVSPLWGAVKKEVGTKFAGLREHQWILAF